MPDPNNPLPEWLQEAVEDKQDSQLRDKLDNLAERLKDIPEDMFIDRRIENFKEFRKKAVE